MDIILLIMLGYFAYKGFSAGLIRELFGIIGVTLAVLLTFVLMEDMKSILMFLGFSPGDYLSVIAGLILFFGTVLFSRFLANLVHKMLEIVSLNMVNQIFGMLFGALKTGIVLSAILLLLLVFNLPPEKTRNESVVYPKIIYLAPAVYDIASAIYPGAEDLITVIEKNIKENNPLKELPLFEK